MTTVAVLLLLLLLLLPLNLLLLLPMNLLLPLHRSSTLLCLSTHRFLCSLKVLTSLVPLYRQTVLP